ncbi:DUF1800 domain-containing protein [Catenovulum adriaticum]|uniref:DUF1800 domain-containing protein n=1 Tax=Catenovulum adriaticum TaxID=2984846 RepID=A0ABY7ANY2_9ALTE|nr:DUF1800 domain-containing protein [Catenovulum sp. TS8]WAJ71214.1 DUF1800 domain-containing protein [Catenovulum sp. TS8]
MSYSAEIALNRFGYGARPYQISQIQSDPKTWLTQQLKPLQFADANWTSAQAIAQVVEFNQLKKREKKQTKKMKQTGQPMMQMQAQSNLMRKNIMRQADQLAQATFEHAIETQAAFQARLLDFFSNHFSVSHAGLRMRSLAPTLEREAIAPNLSGQFEDLLLAVETHPAMLIYLNNEQSIGPDSKQAKKRKNKGLNENLAREILELHTLGVNGGYTQADVRELAMAISGWSVSYPKAGKSAGFMYREYAHQPGIRKILNKNYNAGGLQQGKQILADLAKHPHTAEHISYKLAKHFISDEPDTNLILLMKEIWLATDGNLTAVLTTLIEHPSSWKTTLEKYKTPRDFVISACRACEPSKNKTKKLFTSLMTMGQAPFSAGSPAGFGDHKDDWNGAEAFMARIEWADQFSQRIKKEPASIAKACLGNLLSARTEQFIKRAESRQQALALLLMSPEFQQR